MMQCPSCAAEVSEGSRFCNLCGVAMPVLCRACGHSNAAGSNFCANCGTRLTAGRSPTQLPAAKPQPRPPQARRTAGKSRSCSAIWSARRRLSARLDPEDLREVIGAYYREVAEDGPPFGGFVAQYYGDGVLVYFGYPQAHEQDAETGGPRRIGAGRRSQRARLAGSLQTRIGIATGLVGGRRPVRRAGERQGHGIVGETSNLAARLQAIADPNMVVIDEATRRLIGDLFELHDLGARDLKGITGLVQVWAVLRPHSVESRFEALHATGYDRASRTGGRMRIDAAALVESKKWRRPGRAPFRRGRHRQIAPDGRASGACSPPSRTRAALFLFAAAHVERALSDHLPDGAGRASERTRMTLGRGSTNSVPFWRAPRRRSRIAR